MAWTFNTTSKIATAKGTSCQRYTAANGWETSGGMAQGAYGTYNSGKAQLGYCQITDLSSFDLNKYKIEKFRIKFTFSSSGGNRKKTMSVSFNSSKTTSTSGNLKLSDKTTAGIAYNATTYVEYTSETDINTLIQAITEGKNRLYTYRNESASGSGNFSTNYARMTACSIEIYYSERASLFHVYDGVNQVWKDPVSMWVYKTSDNAWHQVGRVLVYPWSDI